MAMYAGIQNDPRIDENEDRLTAATLNGSTQAAYEAGIPLPQTLTQRASDIARAEEAKFNTDLANKYAQAEIWTPVIQNMMTQAQPQQPQTERQAPVLTQGLMPGFGEGATYQAGYIPGQEQAEPQQPQTLTQMARQKALDIINAKNLYAQGEAIGGEQGAKAMELAHAGAERARADLQQLGVDPAQYGLNGTYEDAAQGLASNDIRAMQNTLEGEWAESSGSYYDRVYKILRDNGFSSDIAEAEAHRRAESYASRRVQALNQAFNTYGHNGQVINPMGIQMLGMMAQEDMDMANYYTQRYAGPLQEYAKQNARENAAIQHQYGKEDRADAFGYDVKKMGIAQEYRKELKDIEFQMQEAHANNNVVREVNKAIQLYEAQAKYGIGKGASKVNGVTKEQVEYAAKMIESIDKQLANGFDLSEEDKKQLQAQKAQYKSVVDAYMPFGQQGGGSIFSGAGVDVNDYDSLRRAYQQIVERNAAAYEKNDPNDPPMSWDELNRAFLAEVGEDNPMALNIVENSPYKTGSSSSGVTSASAPARPSTPQVVYLPATESGDNPGGYADDYGTRGNIPIVGFLKNFGNNIAQSMRETPIQTRAGQEAKRKYGLE